MTLSIEDIKIGDRFRHDSGDLDGLAESIQEHGLLHPIVVTSDKVLIAGLRRLEACRELGWTEIPVTVIDPDDSRKVEIDENKMRLSLTPTEAAAAAKYLMRLEGERARERQGTRTDKHPGNLPESSTGDTRDKVAEHVGMSGRTLEKAIAVTDAAEAEPEKFGPVAEEMDRTGKVDPAFKKVTKSNMKKLDLNEIYMGAAQDAYLALDKKWQKKFRAWLRTAEAKEAGP